MSNFDQAIERINSLIDELQHLADGEDNAEQIVQNVSNLTAGIEELKKIEVPQDRASKDRMIATMARMEIVDRLLKNAKENTRVQIMSVLKRLEANKSYKKQK